MNIRLVGALSGSLLVCGLVAAQSTSISQDGRPERMAKITFHKGLNSSDAKFLMNMAAANNFEIQASRLAESRASSAWAKDFAKEMIDDHTMAQNGLMDLAQSKGWDVRGTLDRNMQRNLNRLQDLNGPAFDRTFRSMQINGHAQVSNLLKKEINRGHDENVREYATKTLPEVVLHWKLAKTGQTMTGANKADHGM